jgi:hypothetical protein
MFPCLWSFRRASQRRPTTDLLFYRNGADAQLVHCVAVNGGDNLGLIALMEAEHICVEKENRHESFRLALIRTFHGFTLGAICLHGRQPCVEQGVFRQ